MGTGGQHGVALVGGAETGHPATQRAQQAGVADDEAGAFLAADVACRQPERRTGAVGPGAGQPVAEHWRGTRPLTAGFGLPLGFFNAAFAARLRPTPFTVTLSAITAAIIGGASLRGGEVVGSRAERLYAAWPGCLAEATVAVLD